MFPLNRARLLLAGFCVATAGAGITLPQNAHARVHTATETMSLDASSIARIGAPSDLTGLLADEGVGDHMQQEDVAVRVAAGPVLSRTIHATPVGLVVHCVGAARCVRPVQPAAQVRPSAAPDPRRTRRALPVRPR